MTNLPHLPAWFPTAFLPPWLAVLLLLAGLSALLVLVRRWRVGARGRAFDARAALWPADIPTYRRSFAVLSAEIARVRRNGRSLAVLVVAPVSGERSGSASSAGLGWGEGNGHGSTRSVAPVGPPLTLAFPLVGVIARDALRECDIVTYDPIANHYVILLPDSDEEKARRAARRLGELIFSRTAVSIKTGVAKFPGDGLILQTLVNRAVAGCHLGAAAAEAHPIVRVDVIPGPRVSVHEG
ncbi:MAG: hypothetical protein DMD45_05385 [Gemmatimonadetes bacterium]|nr:MAG: hypothetical protein DMD45_05385 [Gemmatimonadota bacterium]